MYEARTIVDEICYRPKQAGKSGGWFTGSTRSCRGHIARMHYAVYKRLCKERNIEQRDAAIPIVILDARKAAAAKAAGKTDGQQTLTALGVHKVSAAAEFSPDAILDATSRLIVGSAHVRCFSCLSFTYTHSKGNISVLDR